MNFLNEKKAQQAVSLILNRLKSELSPTLYFHSYEQTLDVISVATKIAENTGLNENEIRLVRIAAAFQNSGFLETYRNHEAESCIIARELLSTLDVDPQIIREIEGMIAATAFPQKPKTQLEKVLCDADLDYLGRDDFPELAQKYYQELSEWNFINSEEEWLALEIDFLSKHKYWTTYSRSEREFAKTDRLKKMRIKAQKQKTNNPLLSPKKVKRIAEIDVINEKAWTLNRDFPQASIDLARDTLEMSVAKKYDYGKAEACHIIGAAYGWMNRFEPGISFTERAAKILLKNGFKSESARAKASLATIHYYRADFQSALRHYTESLNLYVASSNKVGEADAYQGLGAVYSELGKDDQAWEYLNRSLALAENASADSVKLKTLSSMARLSNIQGKHSEAIEYFKDSLRLSQLLNQIQSESYALQGLGDCYLATNQLNEASQYLNQCLEMRLKIDFKAGMARTHQSLGKLLLKKGDLFNAKNELLKSLEIASEGDRKSILMHTHKILSDLYRHNQDFNLFASHLEKHFDIAAEIGAHSKVRRQNFELEQAYQNTRILSEIGQDIISSLDFEKVLFTIYDKVNQLMDASVFGIGLLNSEQNTIDYKLAIGHGVRYVPYSRDLNNKNQLPVWCIDHKTPVFINDLENESAIYIEKLDDQEYRMQDGSTISRKEQSILYMPIMSGTEVLGLITVQSLVKHSYTLYHLEILRNVATYASIALINIGMYQRLETEVKERTLELTKTKEKSDKLLLNILPREIAEELKLKGYTTVRKYEVTTVLFMDIVDFSKISEGLSPKQLVAEIDTYFSAFDEIMDEFGMEKIKTIGDAYISVGGLPRGNKADALTVVKAAFAIIDKVEKFREERESLNASFFNFRIGINTGPVVAGVVGSKKFQYDIWGDAVNIAARMEQSSEAGKINISNTTYERIKDFANCTYRGKLEAKNKGKIDMYFVDSLKSDSPVS